MLNARLVGPALVVALGCAQLGAWCGDYVYVQCALLTDEDGDGWQVLLRLESHEGCDQPWVDWFGSDEEIDGLDCDDSDADLFPSAPERCSDGIDQDCDGIDLECTKSGLYWTRSGTWPR